MKKVLRKSSLVASVLVLIVVSSGIVLAGNVIVKEGDVTADNAFIDTLSLSSGSITDSTGAIDFGDTSITAPQYLDSSLVGCWQFNGNAMDSWMNENDGTFMGGADAEKGVLELDGDGDYVRCDDHESLDLQNDFSISIWFKADDWEPGIIVCKGDVPAWQTDGAYTIVCVPSNGTLGLYVRNSSNTDFGYAVTPISLNQWTHIVGTFSDGNISIYKNGAFVADDDLGTTTINTNNGRLGIGAEGDGGGIGGDTFKGLIDDLMIFDRVLEDWEIRQLYKRPKKYGHFIKLYSDTLDVSGNIYCAGDLDVDGKITGSAIDPSFVLYDRETRQGIIELATATIPPNKQDGAALFFNKETKRLEIYVQSEGKFYDLQGNLIFSLPEPVVATTFKTRRYHLDTRTGEVRELQTVDAKRCRVKEGYKFDTETGKFYKLILDFVNQVVTKEEVTKDEAIIFE